MQIGVDNPGTPKRPACMRRVTISAAGGTTADGVLQADKAALQQADRGGKQWLTRIVQKSELAKSYVPQRGKKK
ncbi:hypothetical protein CE91St44_13910 [Oscillospiraceae bacterium]|nr:hypothetical protein CE91St44_13910 [Oscillospiraceae bacterium]